MSNSNMSKTDDDIARTVDRLMKNKSRGSYDVLNELRSKYDDEALISSIMNKYKEKMRRVKKIAEKIRERLLAKYPDLSQKEYIEKIYGYKKKYGFDDSELQAIINLVLLKKDGLIGEDFEPNVTEMSKALGFVPVSYQTTGRLKISKDEQEQVEIIKGMAFGSKELHNQVTIQSLLYSDCDPSALQSVQIDKNRVNMFHYVHPVVVALFLPKFQLLESHMILASIAEIITKKAEGMELTTLPEYELYWDIATDPAEVACLTKVKPFTDLVNRCNIQNKLWESVLQLRQGKYYMSDVTSFLLAIDACRASVFDAADLAYVKDEGTILRKLFAAFSLRPTLVITTPTLGINTNPNISNFASSHITLLPMYTLRIPLGYGGNVVGDLNLEEQVDRQVQVYIHHGRITLKRQSILHSREILVFYVHRRYQELNIKRLTQPYALAALPVTMSQFEKLSDKGVIVPPQFKTGAGLGNMGEQTFDIKSVVVVQTKPVNNNVGKKIYDIIVSCGTLVKGKFNLSATGPAGGTSSYDAVYYNPLNIGNTSNMVNPIEYLSSDEFDTLTRTNGTLFIYNTPDPKPDC